MVALMTTSMVEPCSEGSSLVDAAYPASSKVSLRWGTNFIVMNWSSFLPLTVGAGVGGTKA